MLLGTESQYKDETPGRLPDFVRAVAIVDAVSIVAVAGVCWLGGWRAPAQVGHALTWASLLVVIAAALLINGGTVTHSEDLKAYTRTGAGNISDQMRQQDETLDGSTGLIMRLFASAAVLLVLGVVLQSVR